MAPAAATAGRRPPAALELLPAGFARLDPADVSQIGDQQILDAGPVPVVMLGAAEAHHVLDHDVLIADPDVPVTPGAAVELLGDAADQPRLVALEVEALQAPACVGKSFVLAHGI